MGKFELTPANELQGYRIYRQRMVAELGRVRPALWPNDSTSNQVRCSDDTSMKSLGSEKCSTRSAGLLLNGKRTTSGRE
jgi:hypothetical protein